MDEPNVFDVAFWKPITPQAYVRALAEAFFNEGDVDPSLMISEQLPNGLFRIVVNANLYNKTDSDPINWSSEVGPYLMTLFSYEKPDTSVSFIRTDRELAH